jgi:signal peptidase I
MLDTIVRPVRHIGRLAFNLLLVAVALAGVAWLAPSLFGYDRYVITGGSMSGTFEKGSIVFEREVPVQDLQVGDVITYLPPRDSGTTSLVTHRIVDLRTETDGTTTLQTKGDANQAADPWRFRLEQPTQPVVEYDVPLAGHVFIALADPQVRQLVIGVPASLIGLIALAELAKGLRPRRTYVDRAPVAASAP